MFCQNCGAKVIEGAGFCRKCGTKLVKDKEIQSGPEPMTEPVPKSVETPVSPVRTASEPEQKVAASSNMETPSGQGAEPAAPAEARDFKTFLDDYVQRATIFQSTDELLNGRMVRWPRLLWLIIVIGAILALACIETEADLPFLASILIWVLLYFVVRFGTSLVNRSIINRYFKKSTRDFSGVCSGKANADELAEFLNTSLGDISPQWNKWTAVNSGELRSTFGAATIRITLTSVSSLDQAVRRTAYSIDISGNNDFWFKPEKYYAPIPVLQGAVEYFCGKKELEE